MTFVIVKPDGVKRGLTGEIIKRIEQRGLKIIALSMETPTRKKIDGHYPKDKKWVTRLGEKTLAFTDVPPDVKATNPFQDVNSKLGSWKGFGALTFDTMP